MSVGTLLLILALAALVLLLSPRDGDDLLTDRGNLIYLCLSHWDRENDAYTDYPFDRRTPPPADLMFIGASSAKATWWVQYPNGSRIKTQQFDLATGSMGGSTGLQWRSPNGEPVTAALSFSDIHFMGPVDMDVITLGTDDRSQAAIRMSDLPDSFTDAYHCKRAVRWNFLERKWCEIRSGRYCPLSL